MHAALVTWLGFVLIPPFASDDGGRNEPEANWPQWRGPLATGVAPRADPPIKWSEQENIRWKIAVPGKGHASPVTWGDRIFLTTAVPYGDPLPPRFSKAPGTHDGVPVTHHHKFVVLAVSRRDGKVIWERTVRQALPHEGGHYTGSLASNSPVTDGEHLFAFFGSYGLYCLDLDGDVLWTKDFGEMQSLHGHGEGSSPALHADTLVMNWDHEGDSFVVAFDKRTGEERWRARRDEATSWATPIIVEHAGKAQVIVSATKRVRGYDLATGRVIWECGGLSTNVVASPVASRDMVFAGSSYDTRAFLAIRLGGTGDITRSKHVAWTRLRGTPYVPSPVLYDDSLYFLTHYQGVLTRVDARTGADRPGAFRLVGIRDVYSSPVAAAGRLYVTDRDGTTLVLSHEDTPRTLGQNHLDDSFSASAALVGRELLLRGEKYLYCIAAE
jgi:outer membrane protein assembly factor BamB